MMFPLSGGYRPTKLLAGGSGRGASSQWMSMSMKIYITRPDRMCMMKNLMMKNLSCPLPPHHYKDSELRIVSRVAAVMCSSIRKPFSFKMKPV